MLVGLGEALGRRATTLMGGKQSQEGLEGLERIKRRESFSTMRMTKMDKTQGGGSVSVLLKCFHCPWDKTLSNLVWPHLWAWSGQGGGLENSQVPAGLHIVSVVFLYLLCYLVIATSYDSVPELACTLSTGKLWKSQLQTDISVPNYNSLHSEMKLTSVPTIFRGFITCVSSVLNTNLVTPHHTGHLQIVIFQAMCFCGCHSYNYAILPF